MRGGARGASAERAGKHHARRTGGERFTAYPPVEGVYFHRLITGILRAKGGAVAQTQHVTQTHSILALVDAGLGVAFVPQSAQRVRFPDVVFVPLEDLQDVTADLLLAWRTQTDNPACAMAVEHGRKRSKIPRGSHSDRSRSEMHKKCRMQDFCMRHIECNERKSASARHLRLRIVHIVRTRDRLQTAIVMQQQHSRHADHPRAGQTQQARAKTARAVLDPAIA